MPIIKKKLSRWEFVGWGSGGVGVGFVASSGGMVVLKSPQGKVVTFCYGGIGAGFSAGAKIPKVPKFRGTGTVGPTPFPSTGWIDITTHFEKDELTESDIRGLCCFAEIGASFMAGASGTAIFLHLDAWRIPALASPSFAQYFLESADAVLYMYGANVGVGAGVSGQIGFLS